MSKHNKFAATGKFFGEAREPLTISAYERYKEKYGEEKAEGYLQAIQDMNEALEDIVRPGLPAGPQKVKTWVNKLYLHNLFFLDLIDDKKNVKTSISDAHLIR